MGRLAISCAVLIIGLSGMVRAQVIQDSVAELRRIDVEEHLGGQVSADLSFVDDLGDSVRLGDYLGQGRPVVLVLGYYRCPMLCNLVFNGLVDGFNQLDWNMGNEFQVLTVSINPEETPELAAAKKINYLKEMDSTVDPSGWVFMVGAEDQSLKLADEVGFKFFYDTVRQEYAHPAVAILLTDDGTISRYLYGIQFSKTDLKLGLLEASEGKIGNTIDRLILYCFHYDPDARGYTVVAAQVMKLGGAVTLVVLVIFLGLLFVGERRRRKMAATTQSGMTKATKVL